MRLVETLAVSAAYVAAFLLSFEILLPLQNTVFPEYPSYASLLFLPHGVRVLAAWLMGWRAVPALLPGVILVFAYVGGTNVFLPNRIAAIVIAVTVAPLIFHALKVIGLDLFPHPEKRPCWSCIMGVGVITSLLIAGLTSLAFGSATTEFVAYLIGDVAGLFFLMLGLLYIFRFMDRANGRNRTPR